MKAIILAAGQGQRLRPLTNDRPKCLVELFNKPLLNYQIEALQACGIHDIVAVTGYCADALKPYHLRKYHNANYSTTNMVYSLFCAQAEFDDDILIAYSDIIYEPRIIQTLIDAPNDFSVIIDYGWKKLWTYRMENPLEDAESLKLDAQGHIIEIGKSTASYQDIQGQYTGLLKIKKEIWPQIQAIYNQLDPTDTFDGKNLPNMYMTSFIHLVATKHMPVKATPIHHGWLEVDTLEDLERYKSLPQHKPELFTFLPPNQTTTP